MNQFKLINIEWNSWNGFMFELVHIQGDDFEGDLFGISFAWKEYFTLYLFFIEIEIKSPFL